jgi:hypothetical protein
MQLIEKDPAVDKLRLRCRKKFLRNFPNGFQGKKYVAWERDYKLNAHLAWMEVLNEEEFKRLLAAEKFEEIARHAVRIESRTNLLFSFEKMALRDAVKSTEGAQLFTKALYDYIYPGDPTEEAFEEFTEALAALPRKQTRVLTWPLQTVFSFIAQPEKHIFLKPRVTQVAAVNYGFPFLYRSKPNWETYASMLEFAEQVWNDLADLKPRDMIDIQSFIWVQGSEEYE